MWLYTSPPFLYKWHCVLPLYIIILVHKDLPYPFYSYNEFHHGIDSWLITKSVFFLDRQLDSIAQQLDVALGPSSSRRMSTKAISPLPSLAHKKCFIQTSTPFPIPTPHSGVGFHKWKRVELWAERSLDPWVSSCIGAPIFDFTWERIKFPLC